MSYLNRSQEELEERSALHTAREIEQQPELWKKIRDQNQSRLQETKSFLSPLLKQHDDLQIILTGAGTSDFIGKSVEHAFFLRFGQTVRAISTTTLVTHFHHYIDPDRPLLLISFARSGNSPESVAVTERAEELCRSVWHLVITCNDQGHLARQTGSMERGHVLLLPPEANDKSLAMTSSFTGMVLSALLTSDLDRKEFTGRVVDAMAASGQQLIDRQSDVMESLARLPFRRVVCLGSGPLHAIAREAHLKVQELTDGQIICKFDSFLGFRHGPKAVVDDETLVIYHFSADSSVLRYERDLARQIEEEGSALETFSIFPGPGVADEIGLSKGASVTFEELPGHCPDALIPLSVLPAQILGFYKSLELGFSPDNPSKNGAISRVVRGVTIYPAT